MAWPYLGVLDEATISLESKYIPEEYVLILFIII